MRVRHRLANLVQARAGTEPVTAVVMLAGGHITVCKVILAAETTMVLLPFMASSSRCSVLMFVATTSRLLLAWRLLRTGHGVGRSRWRRLCSGGR